MISDAAAQELRETLPGERFLRGGERERIAQDEGGSDGLGHFLAGVAARGENEHRRQFRAQGTAEHARPKTFRLDKLRIGEIPQIDFLQRHRSRTLDGFAGVFRTMGSVPVYAGAALGITAGGFISGDDAVKRTGGRLILSELMTVAVDEFLKKVTGRARPDVSASPWDFDPLKNKQVSFVSGHAALAFVLATSLSDDIHNTWASIGLYTFATGTAWSRLNDNRHWPSDVVGGAVLGFTVSKMMSNRWEVLGFDPPRFVQEQPDAAP